MKNRLIASAMLLTAATLLAACGQGYKDTSATVATVNGQRITDLEYRNVVRIATGGAVAVNPLQRKEIIDRLVTNTLLAQEAKKEKLDQNKNVYLELKFTKQSVLARAVIGKYLEAHPVTPTEVRARYDEMKNAKEYKISHILVATEAKANKIIAELKAGKSFAALAKADSKDVDSARRGGEIGWIEKTSLTLPLYDEAAKLKNGEIDPQPVQSQFGWHVIRREGERNAKLPPFAKAAQHIAEQMQGERIQTFIQSLKKKAQIDVVPQKTASTSSTSNDNASAQPSPATAQPTPTMKTTQPAKKK